MEEDDVSIWILHQMFEKSNPFYLLILMINPWKGFTDVEDGLADFQKI